MAKQYQVGVEIDHETGTGEVEMLKKFVKGFRKECPMGKHMLSMDLTGGPSVTNLVWMADVPEALIPEGSPSDKEQPEGDYLDFVNLMVIDACNTAECNFQFWDAWANGDDQTGRTPLNMKRATVSFSAGVFSRPPRDVPTNNHVSAFGDH